MISLTEIAAKNFKRIREDEELPEDVPLRIAVKGGGCAGYEYSLTFGEPAKKDLTFESKGLPIVIDRKSHIVVDGLEIDWSQDLSAPGLVLKTLEQSQRVVVLRVFQSNLLQMRLINLCG